MLLITVIFVKTHFELFIYKWPLEHWPPVNNGHLLLDAKIDHWGPQTFFRGGRRQKHTFCLRTLIKKSTIFLIKVTNIIHIFGRQGGFQEGEGPPCPPWVWLFLTGKNAHQGLTKLTFHFSRLRTTFLGRPEHI